MQVHVDSSSKSYVVQVGRSSVVKSFQYIYETACELARRLQAKGMSFEIPMVFEIGSEVQFKQYSVMRESYASIEDSSLWIDSRTPSKVRYLLQELNGSGKVVRIFYGDKSTGLDWLSWGEPLVGTVGELNSADLRLPSLVSGVSEDSAVIDGEHIVKIVDVMSKQCLYQHSKYHLPTIEVLPSPSDPQGSFKVVSSYEGESNVEAYFDIEDEALNFIKFLEGSINLNRTM